MGPLYKKDIGASQLVVAIRVAFVDVFQTLSLKNVM